MGAQSVEASLTPDYLIFLKLSNRAAAPAVETSFIFTPTGGIICYTFSCGRRSHSTPACSAPAYYWVFIVCNCFQSCIANGAQSVEASLTPDY